jgi:putative transposase
MKKNYQTTTSRARTGRTTPKKAKARRRAVLAHEAAMSLPDTVTVAIAELAGELEEGLLAFVVGTGLKVLDVVFESEATALAGRRGSPRPERTPCATGATTGW